MTPKATRGPRVHPVTESEATVNHSEPNNRPDPRAFHYPIDGAKLAEYLAMMIGDYYIEAAQWKPAECNSIRLAADVLWDIRDRLITNEISVDDAAVWAEQGFAYLDGLMRKRSRANHPAGKRGTTQ